MLTARKWIFLPTLALFLLLARVSLAAVLIQSPADNRQYDTFTLPNKMQVLVVSDPTLDKAAASLDVEVGSMDNPDDRLGLAHFLEHMLFLGTQKYPKADSYQKFINAHGGSNNAFTADENTNFFFDVKADALPEALDRFSQFFIAPLFTPKYVDRERHAVYSEFQAKWRDDGRRLYAASKLTMNSKHPMSRFAVGDLTTLGDRPNDPVRKDLVKFYNSHYSANLMHLVIMGPQPLEQLRQLATDHFSAVANHNFQPTRAKQPLYDSSRLPLQIDVKTLTDTHLIRLTFPVTPVRQYWQSKPLNYLANLIGYEGKGSLLSRLKQLGWAESLGASTGSDQPNNTDFLIAIELTDKGYAHYDQVVSLVFDYINKLKQNGISEMLYDQQSQLAATDFRFMDKGEPLHEVTRLTSLMTRYPATHVLDGPYLMNDFDPKIIRHYLDQMTPDNLVLMRASQDVKTDSVSQRYKVDYHLGEIPTSLLARWKSPKNDDALSIPGKNPYVATDFSLIKSAADTSHPKVVWQKKDAQLWYLADTDFKTPKADLFFTLLNPQSNRSARDAVLTGLYAAITDDRLNEMLYDAGLAGLSTNLYAHMRGISVRVSGYNDKQQVLLNAIVKGMRQLPSSEARFARIKQSMMDSLRNATNDRPYSQGFNALFYTLTPSWNEKQQLAALKSLTLKDLREFTPTLFNQSYLRVLAHGNMSKDTAIEIANTIHSGLMNANNQPAAAPIPVIQLPAGKTLTKQLDIDHNDSMLIQYLQADSIDVKTAAPAILLGELLATPFYNELRTQQQLGYIVFANYSPIRRTPGLSFVVESPKASPQKLIQAQNKFIDEAAAQLTHINEPQLNLYKQSALSRINKEDTSLAERSHRLWHEIDYDDTQFDYRQKLSAAIKAVKPADLSAALIALHRRTLRIVNYGTEFKSKASKTDNSKTLNDLRDKHHWVEGSTDSSKLPIKH